jgi:hypothetical protein
MLRVQVQLMRQVGGFLRVLRFSSTNKTCIHMVTNLHQVRNHLHILKNNEIEPVFKHRDSTLSFFYTD